MMVPTIHSNGTSAKSLIDGWDAARYSLAYAYEDLKKTAPNGRDFYPQGDGALKKAIEEHTSRLQRIDDVMRELDSLIEAVCGQSQ